jgi:hypothetical protein
MFRNHIDNSEIKQPENYENFNPDEYPHFNVFMITHLGNAFDPDNLKENADIIASIPDEQIRKVTYNDLIEMGVTFSCSGVLV